MYGHVFPLRKGWFQPRLCSFMEWNAVDGWKSVDMEKTGIHWPFFLKRNCLDSPTVLLFSKFLLALWSTMSFKIYLGSNATMRQGSLYDLPPTAAGFYCLADRRWRVPGSLGVLRVPTTIKEVGVWLSRFPIPTTKWRTIWNSVGWRFCEKTIWFVLICKKKLIGRWAFTEELLFWCRDPVGRLEGVTFEEIEQIWYKLVMKSYIWSARSAADF